MKKYKIITQRTEVIILETDNDIIFNGNTIELTKENINKSQKIYNNASLNVGDIIYGVLDSIIINDNTFDIGGDKYFELYEITDSGSQFILRYNNKSWKENEIIYYNFKNIKKKYE